MDNYNPLQSRTQTKKRPQGQLYMITNNTHHWQPLLSDFWSARLLVQTLKLQQHRASTLAFVIMPDHFHWLIHLKPGISLERLIAQVKDSSAVRINQRLERETPVWQPRFYHQSLMNEQEALTTARHLVSAPLQAGLASNLADYPHWDAHWLSSLTDQTTVNRRELSYC